jgi:hypothetical protein
MQIDLSGRPKNWIINEKVSINKNAIIFDIDGVLADASLRQHFLDRPRRDWDGFFNAAGDDPLIKEMGTLMTLIDPQFSFILMTGRPSSIADLTVEWLATNNLRWDLLITRNWGDYSRAREFKALETNQLLGMNFEIVLAFEDDKRNVEMFRENGVPCIYIESGYY